MFRIMERHTTMAVVPTHRAILGLSSFAAIVIAFGAVAGCGGDDESSAVSEPAADAAQSDATPDVVKDGGPEASPDAHGEASDDATLEASTDAKQEAAADAKSEASSDAGPDGPDDASEEPSEDASEEAADDASLEAADDASLEAADDAVVEDAAFEASAEAAAEAGPDAAAEAGLDAEAGVPPTPPKKLNRWVVGAEADAPVSPGGPGLILMGGGTDVDAAFQWWKPMIAGGDVVILRTSGSDGYNDYLYTTIGGCDSVETLMVTSIAFANDPYVAWAVSHAEGIFLAGGDQATYLANWKGTALQTALQQAWNRGAVIGGTSAGLAVLGAWSFAAYQGSVLSSEALADPYNPLVSLERDFLAYPPLARVITDSHFFQRDRLGRLVTFVARIEQDGWGDPVLGMGIDESTALVVGPDSVGSVLGTGKVYLVDSHGKPSQCVAGQPLVYSDLTLRKLSAGDTIQLPAGTTTVAGATLSAQGGALTPANPY